MRIAILLQSLDETWGAIGVYRREIVSALLRVDSANKYVLIYPRFGSAKTRRGQFRRHKNAIEIETEFSRVPFGAYWDQVIVPSVAAKYNVDVLFPFLTVPVRGKFGKVMIMHNVEYHVVPKAYDLVMFSWWFMLEKGILRSADSRHLDFKGDDGGLPQARELPDQSGAHDLPSRQQELPDRDRSGTARVGARGVRASATFILFVGHFSPQKNFAVLARAFARLKNTIPHRLIVAGPAMEGGFRSAADRGDWHQRSSRSAAVRSQRRPGAVLQPRGLLRVSVVVRVVRAGATGGHGVRLSGHWRQFGRHS